MDETVIVVFVFSSSYHFVVQTRSLIKKRLSITIIETIKISYGLIIIVTFSQFITLFLKLLLSKSFLLFFVLV